VRQQLVSRHRVLGDAPPPLPERLHAPWHAARRAHRPEQRGRGRRLPRPRRVGDQMAEGYGSPVAQATARPEGVYDVASRITERLTKIAEMLDTIDRRVN